MNVQSPSVLPSSKAIQFLENQQQPTIADWQQIGWSLDDTGPIYGVVLVERARTFGSKLINLRWNIERLRKGAKTIGLNDDAVVAWYQNVCELILESNSALIKQQDVSVVVLFSPIEFERALTWKSIAYLSPIPFARLNRWYQNGCQLKTSTIGIIPNSVFPTSLKHRSRIHYWLADRGVREMNAQNIAVLMDADRRLGDCSVANLIFIDHHQNWFTPDEEYSHHGTTLKQSMELLETAGTIVQARPVEHHEAISCQEMLLVGSTGVAWSASSIDDTILPNSRIHCHRLQSLWVNHLQYSFTSV
ncbi:MAG: aminotransferase class IV [Pirellula sp.]